MENYEREDVFTNVVNKNKQFKDEDLQMQKDIAFDVLSFSKQIAQADARTKMIDEQSKHVERKNKIKMMAVAGALLATLAAGLTTTVVYGDEILTNIDMNNDMDEAIMVMTRNTNRILDARGLTCGGFINDNSISDYKALNVNSIKDVYIYKYESSISRSKEEFDKFIRSVSYYNEEGNICFYSSFENFLEINGFNNEKEFKEAAKKIILVEYRNGKITELPYEGIDTVNRGGR